MVPYNLFPCPYDISVFNFVFKNGGNTNQLPSGWEERTDPRTGRVYYVDHNTHRTTWERPTANGPVATSGGTGEGGPSVAAPAATAAPLKPLTQNANETSGNNFLPGNISL